MGKHTIEGSAGKKSGSDSPKEVVVGSGASKIRMPKFSQRSYTVIAAVVVIAGIIIVTIFLITRHRLPANISSVCTDAITSEASTHYKMGDAQSLTQLTYKIKVKNNYQNDPNCTYIMAQQQLLNSDVNSAEATINELEKTYGTKYKFNSKLDDGKASIATLRDHLRLMQNVEENSRGRFDPDI